MNNSYKIDIFNSTHSPFRICERVSTQAINYDVIGPSGVVSSTNIDEMIVVGEYAYRAFMCGRLAESVAHKRALSHQPTPIN